MPFPKNAHDSVPDLDLHATRRLRDEFAARAMQTLLNRVSLPVTANNADTMKAILNIAMASYLMADEMMKERER